MNVRTSASFPDGQDPGAVREPPKDAVPALEPGDPAPPARPDRPWFDAPEDPPTSLRRRLWQALRGFQGIAAWVLPTQAPLTGAPTAGRGAPLPAHAHDPDPPRSLATPNPDEPRPHRYTVVSAEDHLVEPPDLFEGRLSAEVANAAPRVVDTAAGQCWELDGTRFGRSGGLVASNLADVTEPGHFDELRRGCFDVHARIQDMDDAGVWASLCLPSQVVSFTERLFASAFTPKIGLTITRAYNDWLHEEWCGPYPDRLVPCGITYLANPSLGAAEIYRNARRGFRAVVLPGRPHRRGLPSVFSGHWDPIVDACEDTETVICLRCAEPPALPPDAPSHVLSPLLVGHDSLTICAEWLSSGLAVRFPEVRFLVSGGGIGWVAMLVDRLAEVARRLGEEDQVVSGGAHLDSIDVLHRNFWFTTTADPSTIVTRSVVGIDHIVTGVGYPHAHSTWPDTQEVIDRAWGHLHSDEVAKLTYANACRLLRWRVPEVWPSSR